MQITFTQMWFKWATQLYKVDYSQAHLSDNVSRKRLKKMENMVNKLYVHYIAMTLYFVLADCKLIIKETKKKKEKKYRIEKAMLL